MLSFIISRLVILIFGTLYPAYASYKAVKTKDIKEYVKWMMYWIVFAFFTAGEIFLDVFLSFWFPFYYELKIMFVVWLLCPATKGSNFMYRKFVHPLLSKREKDIDDYLERCKEDGYSAVLKLGSKAVSVATNTFIETAVRLHTNGLLQGLRKSYSVAYLNDQNYDLGNQDVMYDRKISMSRSSLATDLPSPSEPIFSAYRRDFGGSLEALNEPISRPRRVSTRRTEVGNSEDNAISLSFIEKQLYLLRQHLLQSTPHQKQRDNHMDFNHQIKMTNVHETKPVETYRTAELLENLAEEENIDIFQANNEIYINNIPLYHYIKFSKDARNQLEPSCFDMQNISGRQDLSGNVDSFGVKEEPQNIGTHEVHICSSKPRNSSSKNIDPSTTAVFLDSDIIRSTKTTHEDLVKLSHEYKNKEKVSIDEPETSAENHNDKKSEQSECQEKSPEINEGSDKFDLFTKEENQENNKEHSTLEKPEARTSDLVTFSERMNPSTSTHTDLNRLSVCSDYSIADTVSIQSATSSQGSSEHKRLRKGKYHKMKAPRPPSYVENPGEKEILI